MISNDCKSNDHVKCNISCTCDCHTATYNLSYKEVCAILNECMHSWISRDDLTAYNTIHEMRVWKDSF